MNAIKIFCHRQISLYTLMLLIAALPFSLRIWGAPLISTAILVLLINWIAEGNFVQKWQRFRANRQELILFAGFYLLHLAGMLYTDNTAEGWFNLEKKFPMLALPLVLATMPPLEEKHLKTLKNIFVAACVIAVLVCLLYGVARVLEHRGILSGYVDKEDVELAVREEVPGYWDFFSYSELGEGIGIHPTYFGFYLLFAIFILAEKFATHSITVIQRIVFAALILGMSVFMMMLSARIVIVVYLLVVCAGLTTWCYRQQKIYRSALLIPVVTGLTLGIIYCFPLTSHRLFAEVSYEYFRLPTDPADWNSVNLRVLHWKASMEHIVQHWFWGVGTGDAQDKLNESYSRVDMGIYKGAYNSHNQYLQTTLTLGFFGGIWFVLSLLLPMKKALQNKHCLCCAFLGAFALCCTTESMLQMQKGIVLYALFNSLFAFHAQPASKHQ